MGFATATPAFANGPEIFGHGARSASLARADIAEGDPTDTQNPAFAASPGVRLRLGYGYGAMLLSLNGADAGVADVSGIDFAAQVGADITPSVQAGLLLAVHLPDTSLATIAFRPGTEPQFPLYESALQRTAADLGAALRYRWISIGGGVVLGLRVAGDGTSFDVEQDAAGTHGDAAAYVELPYAVAPLAGVRLNLGRLAIGAAFRGAMAVDMQLDNVTRVALTENPLNGTTTVKVSGSSGFDPARLSAGAAVSIGAGFVAYAAMEVAFYSAAPPPVADVAFDVRLGTIPSLREVRFIEPRFRTTLSPRIALEVRRPAPSKPVELGEGFGDPSKSSPAVALGGPRRVCPRALARARADRLHELRRRDPPRYLARRRLQSRPHPRGRPVAEPRRTSSHSRASPRAKADRGPAPRLLRGLGLPPSRRREP
ncbi:MAG: hypothetical protein L6Q76_36750 [Polyangiaceae bacterium]|nr:hypothetical protein [Polyangiaceae bacterium]